MTTEARKPWHDAPACPHCQTPVGTPIRGAQRHVQVSAPEANLWCPACGGTWVANAADLAQAEASYVAWQEEERRRTAPAETRGPTA